MRSCGALVSANRQNDERRLFMETVLAGVSAGVIGLDHDGTITVVNRAGSAAAQRRAGRTRRPPLRGGRAGNGRIDPARDLGAGRDVPAAK